MSLIMHLAHMNCELPLKMGEYPRLTIDAEYIFLGGGLLGARLKMEASNSKALREALEDSQWLLEHFSRGDYGAQVREQMSDNSAALAAPPRNCDVGTAEEQYARYCKSLEKDSGKSVLDLQGHYELTAKFFAYWAQMPYSESEADYGREHKA